MLGCHNGACNPYALIKDLDYAMTMEVHPFDIRESKEIPYVVAHIAFLLGQGPGPNQDLVTYAESLVSAREHLRIGTEQINKESRS